MSDLHQRIFVNCPAHAVPIYIGRFFEDRRQADVADPNEPVRIALRAPVRLPALQTEIVLQRDVVASIKPLPSNDGTIAAMDVEWEPAGGGPFPRFRGKLTAEGDEDNGDVLLVLNGSYTPPLGIAGQAFDAALGHRIAIATARGLLADVRDTIERAYAASEYKKEAKRLLGERNRTSGAEA